MTDYRAPIRDIVFALDNLAGLDNLCDFDAFGEIDRDTVVGVIEESGRFFEQVVAPLYRAADEGGGSKWNQDGTVTTPEGYIDAYRQYVDAGWGAVPFPQSYGGGGFPWISAIAMQEILTSADLSFSMGPLLTQGAIDMLLHHGSEEQKEVFLPKMVTGEWSGTMNLTEPEAGSDVGALRTKAVPHTDGSYRISGQKIFITFGEHDMTDQIVHLVLARTPDAPPGTKGISCFIVPKLLVNDDGSLGERNDVRCASIEHKMGIRASPTCVLSYGDDGDGAVGYLIGEENQGMRYMFTMMNNARLSVGVEGLSLSERAYQQALAYAVERKQGRAPGAPKGELSPIIDHPDVRRMLMTMRSTIEAMRGLLYIDAAGVDATRHADDIGVRSQADELVDLLTPMSKGWCTDMAVELTSLNIQIHGGMGFIEETGAAQLYRDARIPPIYEGTNGIQAMDLVARKLPMRGGAVMSDHLARIRASADEVAGAEPQIADAVRAAADDLEAATTWLFEHGLTDIGSALAGATPYLRLASLATAGWVMAQQAEVATGLAAGASSEDDKRYYAAKVETARFFCTQIVPQTAGLVPAVCAGAAPIMGLSADDLASVPLA